MKWSYLCLSPRAVGWLNWNSVCKMLNAVSVYLRCSGSANSPQWFMQSYSPHSSASGPLEEGSQPSGLGCFGLARSHLSFLAWQLSKGASWERGIWPRLRWGKQPGLGAFSQAFLGRLLKVTPTSNKKSFQTQRKAQPGQCQAWLGSWIQKS